MCWFMQVWPSRSWEKKEAHDWIDLFKEIEELEKE